MIVLFVIDCDRAHDVTRNITLFQAKFFSLAENKTRENQLTTCFYFWYVKLATVQIWNQSNTFALICSSL